MEKCTADDKIYHKTCLRCGHCQKVLQLGNYAALNGVFYCKPHFKQLFAVKGNYTDGFQAAEAKMETLRSGAAEESKQDGPSPTKSQSNLAAQAPASSDKPAAEEQLNEYAAKVNAIRNKMETQEPIAAPAPAGNGALQMKQEQLHQMKLELESKKREVADLEATIAAKEIEVMNLQASH
ncbi:LIM domain-containing protein 2 [Kappamyces sp. JEL0829]|nr:LIM domain-containing protein 2 [Kappamyces sp. JEL0829]